VPLKFNFLFALSQFDLPITAPQKKNAPMEEIQGSVLKYRVPPLRPTYTCERRTTFAKAYGTQLERKNPTLPIRKKRGTN
jgi:hypothetical protein